MHSQTSLSRNDNAVLGVLFDPEASLERESYNISVSALKKNSVPEYIKEAEQNAIKLLNVTQPSVQDVSSALTTLTSIIDAFPTYISAYANRAQTRRLQPDALEQTTTIAEIFRDLNSAISLASPSVSTQSSAPEDLRTLSSAHSHRAYLLMHASTNADFREKLTSLNLPFLHTVTEPSQFEELASRDFSIAGRYGNRTAQQLAVKTNPYAKLCGQIVKEALQREIKEYYEGVQLVH